jgi:hypothetical protein
MNKSQIPLLQIVVKAFFNGLPTVLYEAYSEVVQYYMYMFFLADVRELPTKNQYKDLSFCNKTSFFRSFFFCTFPQELLYKDPLSAEIFCCGGGTRIKGRREREREGEREGGREREGSGNAANNKKPVEKTWSYCHFLLFLFGNS